MADKNILAECYGDTLLISQLKFSFLEYHSGIGEVANQMQKHFKNRRAIAVIDSDKSSVPSYFKRECDQIKSENGVVLLKHKKAEHYVIKISPAFEDFINDSAVDCGLDLFEKDKKKFREIIKSSKLHSNSKFVNYLNRLIAKNRRVLRHSGRLLKKLILKSQRLCFLIKVR